MSDAVLLQIVISFAALLTLIVNAVIQTKMKGTIDLTHDIVNSQRTAMEAQIKELKEEIGKLNIEGGSTPSAQDATVNVTMDGGQVTAKGSPIVNAPAK